jgi:uncharacterized protein YbaR (Trm112 family)
MTSVRPGLPGATRTCPHCRATVLESATVCPACKHHLRFDRTRDSSRKVSAPPVQALRVEGTIEHPNVGESWEYSVFVSIRNERGEEIARHVAGVGAMNPREKRSFTLAVEVFKP